MQMISPARGKKNYEKYLQIYCLSVAHVTSIKSFEKERRTTTWWQMMCWHVGISAIAWMNAEREKNSSNLHKLNNYYLLLFVMKRG